MYFNLVLFINFSVDYAMTPTIIVTNRVKFRLTSEDFCWVPLVRF